MRSVVGAHVPHGILHDALPETLAWHNLRGLYCFVGALAFIAAEEEQAVFLDRSSDPRSESIAVQDPRFVGLSRR